MLAAGTDLSARVCFFADGIIEAPLELEHTGQTVRRQALCCAATRRADEQLRQLHAQGWRLREADGSAAAAEQRLAAKSAELEAARAAAEVARGDAASLRCELRAQHDAALQVCMLCSLDADATAGMLKTPSKTGDCSELLLYCRLSVGVPTQRRSHLPSMVEPS